MAGNVPHPSETNLLKIVRAIRDLFEGRSNAVGSVTLATGAASTTVTAINCGPDSKIILEPRTANAAAEKGNGTMYVSSKGAGSFVITHANNAQADRTFDWIALG